MASSWPVNTGSSLLFEPVYLITKLPAFNVPLTPIHDVVTLIDPDVAWLVSENDPAYTFTPANQLAMQLALIGDVLYFTVVSASNGSFLLMYTRIFSVSAPFRRQVWILGSTVAAFWVRARSPPYSTAGPSSIAGSTASTPPNTA